MTNETATIDVVVRDGSTVCLRRAEERDVEALLQFLDSLSPQSLYYRFLGLPSLSASGVRDADRGHGGATSLVAESGGRIVAFAGFYRDPDSQPIAPRWRLPSPTRCRATASARACSSASRTSRGTTASAPSTPTCWATTAGCSTCFGTPGFAVTTDGRARGLPRRPVALGHRPLRREGRRAVANRGDGVDEGVLRAAGRRRRRRQPRTRQDRIGDPAQPRGGGVHGHHRARAPDGAEIEGLTAYPRVIDIPGPSTSPSSSSRRRTCSQAVDDCIEQARAARSASSAPASANATPKGARAKRRCSTRIRRGGLPPDRAQLHGPAQHRPGRAPERDVLAGLSAGRQRRDVHAERRAGPGDPRLREDASTSASRASSRSATRRTSRETI